MSGVCLVYLAFASSVLGSLFGGCSASPVRTTTYPQQGDEPARASARLAGDWNDINSAAEIGSAQSECVWVGAPKDVSPTERVFHLAHISGATGTLTVTRADAERDEDIPITLVCAMGRFGEPELERSIIEKSARRLGDLRGKEFAPVAE